MTRPDILIVEDDAMTSALLRVLFEKQGFEVTLIQDGQTALDHLNEKPACRAVLLDILLPHVNGLHAAMGRRKNHGVERQRPRTRHPIGPIFGRKRLFDKTLRSQ